MRRFAVLALFALTLAGCAGSFDPAIYTGNAPKLVLEDYFRGKTVAYGVFENREGKLAREFKVDATGTWDGKILTLEESFLYKDGEKAQRVWRIEKIDEHTYVGRADDVVGDADIKVFGNAAVFTYQLDFDNKGKIIRLTFEDHFYLQEDGVLITRGDVTKYGFDAGLVMITFIRPKG